MNRTHYSGINSSECMIKKIKYYRYTRSLIEKALEDAIITSLDINRINDELMIIFQENLKKYSDKMGHTLSVHEQEEVLISILYSLNLYLVGQKNDQSALEELVCNAIGMLYQKSLQYIKYLLLDISFLYLKVKKTLPIQYNIPLNDTMESIKRFLSCYDYKFGTQHAVINLRYPLAIKIKNQEPLLQLRSYLIVLLAENSFCNNYAFEEVDGVFRGFCNKKHYKNPSKACLNIFTSVFFSALFCDYLKKEYGSLSLDYKDTVLASKMLSSFSEQEKIEILKKTAFHLRAGSTDYNNIILMKQMPHIILALKHKTLHRFLMIDNRSEETHD